MEASKVKVGDWVILAEEPSFSTGGRKGVPLEVVQRDGYLAIRDEKGVCWPLPVNGVSIVKK